VNRLLLVGLVGIALLTAVGLGAVALFDRALPATAPGPARAAPPSVQAPPPRPLEPLPPLPSPAAPPAQPAPAPQPAKAEVLPSEPAARVVALEPLRREVHAGLEMLATTVRACRLPDVDLMLTLETLPGRVRVSEVVIQPRGAAEAERTSAPLPALDIEAARCVRGALEGRVLEAPSSQPGRPWVMTWEPGATP